jgi:hypothetical protein
VGTERVRDQRRRVRKDLVGRRSRHYHEVQILRPNFSPRQGALAGPCRVVAEAFGGARDVTGTDSGASLDPVLSHAEPGRDHLVGDNRARQTDAHRGERGALRARDRQGRDRVPNWQGCAYGRNRDGKPRHVRVLLPPSRSRKGPAIITHERPAYQD